MFPDISMDVYEGLRLSGIQDRPQAEQRADTNHSSLELLTGAGFVGLV